MLNWKVDLTDRLEAKFQAAARTAQQDGHFEQLYTRRDDEKRSVSLCFGSHPVGASLQGNGLAVEGGAALVFLQGVDGSVGVILYPYKSELMRRTETHIIWNVFDGPEDVMGRVIDAAIADFWRYSRVSSCLNGGSRSDQARIRKLVKKSRAFNLPEGGQPEATTRSWLHKALTSRPALLIGFLSGVATLSGFTVPQLWNQWHQSGKVAEMPSPVAPVPASSGDHPTTTEKASPPPRPAMSVIEGHYTLCPTEAMSTGSTRWLNFLYDVDANAGKTVFVDVSVDVGCLVGQSDPERSLGREAKNGQVEYAFRHLPLFDKSEQRYIAGLLDGPRDIKRLPDIIPDNGVYISVRQDQDGRNAHSRLQVNSEGLDDIIYGPFLIKKGGEDGFVTFELSPPILDSVSEDAVSRIVHQRAKQ